MTRIGDRGEMEAFVRSIELGGFSAAARELKLTPSALSKLVSRLEGALKVRLLNRTTRKLTPTAEGELFLARCRRILAEMEDAETEVGRSRVLGPQLHKPNHHRDCIPPAARRSGPTLGPR